MKRKWCLTMPNTKEKLIELQLQADITDNVSENTTQHRAFTADLMIANGVTVQDWISVEAGELQNYIGVPVCIKRKTDGECWWAIVRGIKGDKVSTDYGGYFKLSEYGETWIVKYLPLPQPPKEGDKNGKA